MNWEYATLAFDETDIEDTEACFNDAGKEGWELVTVVVTNIVPFAIFKKPLLE